eukprot:Skav235501  [mRNA]  locus=scaffold625:33028:39252:- [translate_table: standard]
MDTCDDKCSEKRGSPLHAAATRCHLKVIDSLLLARANVNESRADGATPLFCAARSGSPQAVHMLLEAAADQEKMHEDGFQALHIAAANCHAETSRLLMGYKFASQSVQFTMPDGSYAYPAYDPPQQPITPTPAELPQILAAPAPRNS